MKNIIFVAGLMFCVPALSADSHSADVTRAEAAKAQKETKKVCVDVKDKEGKEVKDPKTGKVKQNCKEVKQHKKLEGTDVPVKK
jgi:hypothetical protein